MDLEKKTDNIVFSPAIGKYVRQKDLGVTPRSATEVWETVSALSLKRALSMHL